MTAAECPFRPNGQPDKVCDAGKQRVIESARASVHADRTADLPQRLLGPASAAAACCNSDSPGPYGAVALAGPKRDAMAGCAPATRRRKP